MLDSPDWSEVSPDSYSVSRKEVRLEETDRRVKGFTKWSRERERKGKRESQLHAYPPQIHTSFLNNKPGI